MESTNGSYWLTKFLSLIIPYKCLRYYSPSFMKGEELQYYYPELKLAIELNTNPKYFKVEGVKCHKLPGYNRRNLLCKNNNIKLVKIEVIQLDYKTIRSLTKCDNIEHDNNIKINYLSNLNGLKELDSLSSNHRNMVVETYSRYVLDNRIDINIMPRNNTKYIGNTHIFSILGKPYRVEANYNDLRVLSRKYPDKFKLTVESTNNAELLLFKPFITKVENILKKRLY